MIIGMMNDLSVVFRVRWFYEKFINIFVYYMYDILDGFFDNVSGLIDFYTVMNIDIEIFKMLSLIRELLEEFVMIL